MLWTTLWKVRASIGPGEGIGQGGVREMDSGGF